jgi:phosphoribosylformylglycinamidine cyclo-ligase
MAHITGGGLVDNVPRMLPKTTDAVFDRASWTVPPIFTWLQEKGRVDPMEMFRVFNMGIGYVIAVPRKDAAKALNALERAKTSPIVVGAIEDGSGITRFK